MPPEKNSAHVKSHDLSTYWGAVYAMALCSFVLVAAEFMPVSLLSPIASDLSLSEGQAGQTVSICSLAALLSSLTIRKLAGSVDRRRVLLFLTALLTISGPLVALAPNYAVLMSGRVFVGVALGGFWSMSAATAMRLVPPRSVPRALAVISGGTAIAGTVAAPLGSFLGSLIGWRGAFFCIIPVALLAFLWQLRSLPHLPSQGRATPVGIMGLLRRPHVSVGYLGAMVFFAGQYSMFTYLRPYLEQVTHAEVSLVSLSLLVIGVMGFIGTTVVGKVIGKRLHLTLAALAAIMATTMFGFALGGSFPVAVVLLLAVWGFCGTSAQVTWWAWVTRAAADDAEAGGGLLVAVAQVGIFSGATLGGIAYDNIGPLSISFGSAVILVLAAVIALTMGWLSKGATPLYEQNTSTDPS